MADKKRDILEFVEQSNFEQMIPTRRDSVFLAVRMTNIFTPAAFLLNFNNFVSKLFSLYTEVTRMETGFGSSIELLGSEFRGSASESDEIDFGG
jgi:hypothetical protein